MAFLDNSGLEVLVTNIKTLINNRTQQSQPMVYNNYTIPNSWRADSNIPEVYYNNTLTLFPTGLTTNNTKVDIQPTAEANAQLLEDGVASLYIVNDNKSFTAYAIGNPPTAPITVQLLFTEVRTS